MKHGVLSECGALFRCTLMISGERMAYHIHVVLLYERAPYPTSYKYLLTRLCFSGKSANRANIESLAQAGIRIQSPVVQKPKWFCVELGAISKAELCCMTVIPVSRGTEVKRSNEVSNPALYAASITVCVRTECRGSTDGEARTEFR
jgi:hypothetical protein